MPVPLTSEEMDTSGRAAKEHALDYVFRPLLAQFSCGAPEAEDCPCIWYADLDDVLELVFGIGLQIADSSPTDLPFHRYKDVAEYGFVDAWLAAFGDAYLPEPRIRSSVLEQMAPGYELHWLTEAVRPGEELRVQLDGIRARLEEKSIPSPDRGPWILQQMIEARRWDWRGEPRLGTSMWRVYDSKGETMGWLCHDDGRAEYDASIARGNPAPPLEHEPDYIIDSGLPVFCWFGSECRHRVMPHYGLPFGKILRSRCAIDATTLLHALFRQPVDVDEFNRLSYAASAYAFKLRVAWHDQITRDQIANIPRNIWQCPLPSYVLGHAPRRLLEDEGFVAPGIASAEPAIRAPAPAPPPLSFVERQLQKHKEKGFRMFDTAAEAAEYHRRMMKQNPGDCRVYRATVQALADQVTTDPGFALVELSGDRMLEILMDHIIETLGRAGISDEPNAVNYEATECGWTIRPENLERQQLPNWSQGFVILCYDIAAIVLERVFDVDPVWFASTVRQSMVPRVLHDNPERLAGYVPNPVAGRREIDLALAALQMMDDRDAVRYLVEERGMDPETAYLAIRSAEILAQDIDPRAYVITEEYEIPNPLELVPGGLASGRSPSEFDPRALAAGIRVEMEHTYDPRIAEEIAMDHLVEDPEYYAKLEASGL